MEGGIKSILMQEHLSEEMVVQTNHSLLNIQPQLQHHPWIKHKFWTDPNEMYTWPSATGLHHNIHAIKHKIYTWQSTKTPSPREWLVLQFWTGPNECTCIVGHPSVAHGWKHMAIDQDAISQRMISLEILNRSQWMYSRSAFSGPWMNKHVVSVDWLHTGTSTLMKLWWHQNRILNFPMLGPEKTGHVDGHTLKINPLRNDIEVHENWTASQLNYFTVST